MEKMFWGVGRQNNLEELGVKNYLWGIMAKYFRSRVTKHILESCDKTIFGSWGDKNFGVGMAK